MDASSKQNKTTDRRLGDEWLDWDGRGTPESTEAGSRLFLILAVSATAVLVSAVAFFLWLISPRLSELAAFLPRLFSILFFCFAGILLIWVVLFVLSAAFHRPISRLLVIPRLINRLLTLVLGLGRVFGVSSDRLTNSFLKVHNLFVIAVPDIIEPERLLVLTPRCLTRENNSMLRRLRDQYRFQMATVGGGTAARQKIREIRPQMVIAIACERDLISGFREVNPFIPVIGLPNQRPEGPCKNTSVDLSMLEATILKCLGAPPSGAS
jgi:hypothetical protein